MLTFETSRLLAVKPEVVLAALVNVLKELAWNKVAVSEHAFSLTAELLIPDQAVPRDVFVLVVTCIPFGQKAELLLSVSANHVESAKERAMLILRRLSEQLSEMAYG